MVTSLSFLFLALSTFYQVEAQGNGALRLNNNGNTSPSNTLGVVEVYYSGSWGTICNRNTFSSNVYDVVCHQLGYTGGLFRSSTSVSTSPVLAEMSCSSNNYLVVLQCDYNNSPSSLCTTSDNVAVSCYSTRIWALPYTGMIRLQSGAYAGDGRVDVYCNGEWGNVCGDSGFNSETATTVCTQLGYNGHITKGTTPTTGVTWLSNVYCYFSQSCLSSCATCPSSSVSCSSAASVTCSYTTGTNDFGSTRYTCGVDGLSTAAITGIIIGALVGVLCCCALAIGIPICICCCCGIGIGAASRPKYSSI